MKWLKRSHRLSLKDRMPGDVYEALGPGVPDGYDGPLYTGNDGERARDELSEWATKQVAKLEQDPGELVDAQRVASEPLPPGFGQNPDY